MTALHKTFKTFLADQSGATAIEYGMIAGLVVVAILGGVTALADANSANYQLIEDAVVV